MALLRVNVTICYRFAEKIEQKKLTLRSKYARNTDIPSQLTELTIYALALLGHYVTRSRADNVYDLKDRPFELSLPLIGVWHK